MQKSFLRSILDEQIKKDSE
jgi:hypothetical protein